MALGFGGEVATYYAKYRRGYPPAVIDALVEAFGLTGADLVLDLGCGTGQLTLPLAARVRAAAGVDPEPDMLAIARGAGVPNTAWLLGTDGDLPALQAVFGAGSVAAITIAVAVHWMDRDTLFPAARGLLRPGGGIAVVTNGTPLWLQDTDWSRTAKAHLERLFGRSLRATCDTDEAGRRRNRDALRAAGYEVIESVVDYDAELTVDDLVGGLFSAMAADQLPPLRQRASFAAGLHEALAGPFTEHVRVWLQVGVL